MSNKTISCLVLIAIYISLNLLAATLFYVDKRRAIQGRWRIPERTLLISSLLGPFGAGIAMHAAHHKTRKPRFRLVYLFLTLHVMLLAAVTVNLR